MQSVVFNAEKYSFCNTQDTSQQHWYHLVAKIQITMMVGKKLERIVVESGNQVLEDLDCIANFPTLRTARGFILAVNSNAGLFQVKLDPQSYARTMSFCERHKITVTLKFFDTSRPLSVSSNFALHITSGSSNLPAAAHLSSNRKYWFGPSRRLNVLNSYGSFVEYLPWVEENIVADSKLDMVVQRYGMCPLGTKKWLFGYRSSYLSCCVFESSDGLFLRVNFTDFVLHTINLVKTPVKLGKSKILFTDKDYKIQLTLSKEFVYGVVLAMRKKDVMCTLLET